MDDATKTPQRRGFSSRWILDGDRRDTAPVVDAPDMRQSTIDTDGDGIADTLALRVDAVAPRRSILRSMGTWVARSIVTIVLVAALVAAAVAATTAFTAREQLDEVRADRDAAQAQLEKVQADADALRGEVLEAREQSSTARSEAANLERERDELQLENSVLRRMLFEAERRASGGE